MVKYTYDAWGNHKVLDGQGQVVTGGNGIEMLNPFRYRSYYYDKETCLYYLKTRYYDPEICRFITIDDVAYLASDAINGLNLYAYCGNNPVMRVDANGTEWWNPTTWNWGFILDIGITIISVAAGIAVGVLVGGWLLPVVGLGLAVTAGIVAGVAVMGGINNGVNAIYYNYISDGNSSIEEPSDNKEREVSYYVDHGYITRWERWDYIKSLPDNSSRYDRDAWFDYSEYSVHMFAWFSLSWAFDPNGTDSGFFAELAERAYHLNWGEDKWYRKLMINLWGLIGV